MSQIRRGGVSPIRVNLRQNPYANWLPCSAWEQLFVGCRLNLSEDEAAAHEYAFPASGWKRDNTMPQIRRGGVSPP